MEKQTLDNIIAEIKHYREQGYTDADDLIIELESIIEDYEAEKEK